MSCISVSGKYLFPLCLFSVALAGAPAESAEPMGQESSIMYSQAAAHAEAGLTAVKKKDLRKATTHAEMAIQAAHAAQKSFPDMMVKPEAQHDFAEGVKLLENAVKGKGQLTEEIFFKTLVYWDRFPTRKKCHGDGCQLTSTGSCAAPGTACDRFNESATCNDYDGACYCW